MTRGYSRTRTFGFTWRMYGYPFLVRLRGQTLFDWAIPKRPGLLRGGFGKSANVLGTLEAPNGKHYTPGN